MKKLLVLLLTVFALNSCEKDPEIIGIDAEKKMPKVDVCHYDEYTDTWKTISINKNALKAHLAHGDYEGECREGYTYVPDDGFEQHLINLGYDDIRDDYVLTSNINTVEVLDFPMEILCDQENDPDCFMYYSLKNLIGIEDFISLRRLVMWEVPHFEAPTINLKTLNSLEEIILYEVPIDQLDLSNNPLVERVHIEYCGKLRYLNLKNGNNVNITYFGCGGSPDLTCIQVDDYTVDHLDEAPYNTWGIDSWAIFSADCSAEPERTYVPDDGFEQHLINLGYDDILDDHVLTSNINTVESLSIPMEVVCDQYIDPGCLEYYTVKNLIGIEDFSSLRKLTAYELYDFNAPTINLSTLSNFEELRLHTMKIEELDLSNNPLLNILDLWDIDDIKYINLKNGNKTNITFFSVVDNNFGTSSSYCVQVDDVEYSTTNWTAIDSYATFSEDCGF